MNVLIDIHHHDLFRSLYILFHERLNANIYVPYGLDWNSRFNYAPYPSKDTVKQYLIDVANWINIAGDLPNIRFITLDQVQNIKFDILLSSLMENYSTFNSVISTFSLESKQILQVGNNFPVSLIDGIVKNLLSSSLKVYNESTIIHKIFYHQEFDLSKFSMIPAQNIQSIYSLQPLFETGCSPYEQDYDLYCKLKILLPEFDFRCYGSGNSYGAIPNTPDQISAVIKSAGFIFHLKPQGDGYGHIYHNAYACGRPVIFKSEYLVGMTPSLLFNEETSVDLSKLSIEAAAEKIREMSLRYDDVMNKTHLRFKNIVNFDKQFIEIQKWLFDLKK